MRSGRAKLAADDVLLNAVATGQIFSSDQALENHLVDRIGFIEAAIARVAELAEIDPDSVRCVKYERPLGALDALLGTNATSQLQPPVGIGQSPRPRSPPGLLPLLVAPVGDADAVGPVSES